MLPLKYKSAFVKATDTDKQNDRNKKIKICLCQNNILFARKRQQFSHNERGLDMSLLFASHPPQSLEGCMQGGFLPVCLLSQNKEDTTAIIFW